MLKSIKQLETLSGMRATMTCSRCDIHPASYRRWGSIGMAAKGSRVGSQESFSGMVAECLRAPVIALERLDPAMPV
jgi:hypothetical protein